MTSSTSSSTTDDTTDGDDELVDYICAKNAHLKCADLYPDAGLGDDYPTDVLLDECWGAISPDSNVHWSPCVKAPAGPGGYDVARGKCEELCNARMDVIETSMKNACGGAFNPNCRIETEIDCVLDGPMNSWDRPFKLSESPGWECEGGTDMLPAHLGVSDFTLFEGSGTVITPDGITAGMSGVLGFVGYTLSDCNSDECTLTIDALQGLTYSVEGGFVDAAGSGGTYKFEQMGFQGRNVITGTWSKVRGIVSFPSASLDVQFWVGAVTVDGVPISSELNVHTISVDQIVGNLQSETDPLTLNFSHNTPFGTISVSLTTSS
jgi:hypothetical protein